MPEASNIIRLYPAAQPIDAEVVERFRAIPTPNVGDCLDRGQCATGIVLMGPRPLQANMAGTAFTVGTRPGDNLAVHKALELVRPGDVLVIDAQGEATQAVLGEIMVAVALSRGVAGIVVDGAIRDSAAIAAGELPVFARSVTSRGPFKSGPGSLHGAIQAGGVVVNDGDLVLGDDDGVLVVPRARIADTLPQAEAVTVKEAGILAAIADGTVDRSWVDEACTIVEM